MIEIHFRGQHPNPFQGQTKTQARESKRTKLKVYPRQNYCDYLDVPNAANAAAKLRSDIAPGCRGWLVSQVTPGAWVL
jgi:hypothetical protein